MSKTSYQPSKSRRLVAIGLFAALIMVSGGAAFMLLERSSEPNTLEEKIESFISYDTTVTKQEEALIQQQIAEQTITVQENTTISVESRLEIDDASKAIEVYVPVTDLYSVQQNFSTENNESITVLLSFAGSDKIRDSFASVLGVDRERIQTTDLQHLPASDKEIVFIPVSQLSTDVKLLSLNGSYYLDEFTKGAVFREVKESDPAQQIISRLSFANLDEKEVFKTNMTGVTALTREMQSKLEEVEDPLYFSERIGEFLADADLTHVSNEVSFKGEDCRYSRTLFCSPPEFIEALKGSGVDLVELTGNHNNDFGSELNTETIELYRELGWGTVGGGLNEVDAAKPFTIEEDGTTLGVLAYNYPDSVGSGAIAGQATAGANSFDFAKIESDIADLKTQTDFVVVSIQYWECYAYPNGYVEYPTCDVPIGEQEADFKRVVDLGADMVVGSSAHQPQTWEFYEGKPIYYGLGNLYFEQTQWPGTERSIIVSSYFVNGELIQNKLTPTVYDDDLQTRLMNAEEAAYLLQRLDQAR